MRIMKILSGDRKKSFDYCDRVFNKDYFTFSFMCVEKGERFSEIDRFLDESIKKTRFSNEYKGNVVIDLSEWNESDDFNRFFNAFMYFIKDKTEVYKTYACIFVSDTPCSENLLAAMNKFFSIREISMSGEQRSKKRKIGFDITESKEEKCYVRIKIL